MVEPQNTNDQYSEKEVLQEERYLWMARAFSLIAVLAFIANILILVALSGLTPLLRVQPFYMQAQNKDYQVISIVRPDFSSMSDEDLKVLQESLVREYLLARFGISSDVAEMEKRWGIDGPIFAMSESSVYDTFFKTESIKGLEQAQRDGLTRDVRILRVNRQEKYPDSSRWVAEVELVNMSQRISEQYTSKWLITMEVMFQPTHRKMSWAQRLRNPLGFMVTRFGRRSLEENEDTN